MKRLLVFAALVAALALSVSLGGPGTVYAVPVCEELNGDPCLKGARTTCVTIDGWSSQCICLSFNSRWSCAL
ncbi:MAG TPA: hypothetical protein VJ725_23360 [Thermoanaerobaculia bacterium]|nr:hypothetical protein [Thermoanaerobaculia bacterium]